MMEQSPEKALEVLKTRDATLIQRLENISITTVEERKSYEDDLIFARQALQRAEDMRKSLTEPLRLSERRINAFFRDHTVRLSNGINALVKALDIRRKEESSISDEAAMTEAELYWKRVRETKGTGEVVPLPNLVSSPPPKTSHVNMGTVSYREMVEIQIVKPDLVPRDLCDPSLRKIRLRAESGVTDIEGVVITKKFVPYTRSYQ